MRYEVVVGRKDSPPGDGLQAGDRTLTVTADSEQDAAYQAGVSLGMHVPGGQARKLTVKDVRSLQEAAS